MNPVSGVVYPRASHSASQFARRTAGLGPESMSVESQGSAAVAKVVEAGKNNSVRDGARSEFV